MLDLSSLEGFEWDKGNIDKSYQKHGITPKQTEEVFLDENVRIEDDIKHIQTEKRYIAIGKCFNDTVLFVVFTIRGNYIRVISGRRANSHERSLYDQKA